MRKTARTPSWLNLAVGLCALMSPRLLGFNEFSRPTWNAAVTGLATASPVRDNRRSPLDAR